METIALPTKECRGVDMPTGGSYRARSGRPGYIEVASARHANEIRSMLGQDSNVAHGFDVAHLPGIKCPCGRENWSWQKTCGKCGSSLLEVAA